MNELATCEVRPHHWGHSCRSDHNCDLSPLAEVSIWLGPRSAPPVQMSAAQVVAEVLFLGLQERILTWIIHK